MDDDGLEELRNYFDIEGIKVVKNFHLTLKFLGDVKCVNKIKERLKEVKFKPFVLESKTIGFFPNADYIKVIWLGFRESDELNELKNEIDRKLEGLIDKEQREFKGHITIGRVKFVKDKKVLMDKIKQVKIPDFRFEVKEFKLIKSELTEEGPIYEDLGVFS